MRVMERGDITPTTTKTLEETRPAFFEKDRRAHLTPCPRGLEVSAASLRQVLPVFFLSKKKAEAERNEQPLIRKGCEGY